MIASQLSAWPLTWHRIQCAGRTKLTWNTEQLQSKLSDIVSYLSHYGINFMATRIKYAFSMMMNMPSNFAAFEVFSDHNLFGSRFFFATFLVTIQYNK